MATTTTSSDVRLSTLPPASGRAGLGGVIASEFTKIRSVRSTYWTIAALIIVSVGAAALIGWGQSIDFRNHPWDKAGADATQASLGIFFYIGQLIIIVVGAMTITSEYSTGMIRTSLTAMPRRGTVYLGKLVVVTAVALVVSLVTAFLAFFVFQAVTSGTGVSASLFHNVTIPASANVGSPKGGPGNGPPHYTFVGTDVITPGHVLVAVVGTALAVTLAVLIAFGLGAIIRHTAGAITSAIGLMFVLFIIVQFLPSTWHDDIIRFFPSAAGQVISMTVPGDQSAHLWSAWPQLLVTVVWAVVLIGAGGFLFRKRDA